ncbi:hypothetical protein [Actinoplanes derwentensis]|uniref:Uncharacterized protein n=1 Tax=Actinoplanes derwentensis TaxID=113562 RepID=A0A1H2BW29_9ACTN|nr:hypothetical protein [Actinoplanes derwentensis]GID83160.1 hypothetical protein Ade03nite_20840 [Actinoplanes derwentensis]SDT62550.1 hypothetical protein SAMN04489716_4965 [Actinoplanes derwentensis]
MTPARFVLLESLCALAVACVSAYIGGRVHQRHREHHLRRAAFRNGFRHASAAFAARMAAGRRRPVIASPVGRPPRKKFSRPRPCAPRSRTFPFETGRS